jgi:hypothetical protein
MGSGTTKVVVAKIKMCPGKPIEILKPTLYEKTLGFSLESLLVPKDKDMAFGYVGLRKYVEEFEALLVDMKSKLKSDQVDDWACGATAAVRTAVNRNEFLKDVMNQTGVLCQVVEQDHEGRLVYEGVVSDPQRKCRGANRLMVWDIGGGSGQLTYRPDTRQELLVGRYKFGAEFFRDELRKNFPPPSYTCAQVTTEERKKTPNPIGQKNLKEAIRSAAIKGDSAWPGVDKPDYKSFCFVGVGGVHNYAIQATLAEEKIFSALQKSDHPDCSSIKSIASPPTESYSYKQLSCLAHYLADKTDCELKSIFPKENRDFSSTNVSNMVLVLGLMQYMGLTGDEKIYTQRINLNSELLKSKSLTAAPQPIKPMKPKISR